MRVKSGTVESGQWPLLALSLLLLTLSAGCRVVQTAADVPGQAIRAVSPGKKEGPTVDPVEVQQMLLRFAGEFSARMIVAVEKLQRGTNAISSAEMLRWKIGLVSQTCSIASGPNAIANLLDMTLFVTVTRMSVEEHWQPKVFGASATPLLESCRRAETGIWQIAGTVLQTEQQVELRQAIELWHRNNLLPEDLLAGRAVGFAAEMTKASLSGAAPSSSVFRLLQLDPLAGLDPATREIAQTRLFAERALFVIQQMPGLLRWQTELLSVNAVQLPAVQQLVTNSTQIAASVDRFAAVAEKLPGQVRTEREEILKALESQEKNLTPLVSEVRQALTAGSQMSTSLNMTLTTFDALMKRFGVGETNSARPPATNAEPFRIRDYAATGAQLEQTARQLTELLVTLEGTIGSTNLAQLSAQVGPVVQQAQTGGKEIVNYIFWKAVLLVAIILLAAVIYRFLAARLTPANHSKTNSL